MLCRVWIRGFHCVVTISLSLLKDCLIFTEYLCVLNLNHGSVHPWGTYAVKPTHILANTYFRVYNPPHLLKKSVLMRGSKQDRTLPITSKLCFWCRNLDNIISGLQGTVHNNVKKPVHDPFKCAHLVLSFWCWSCAAADWRTHSHFHVRFIGDRGDHKFMHRLQSLSLNFKRAELKFSWAEAGPVRHAFQAALLSRVLHPSPSLLLLLAPRLALCSN